MFSTVWWASFSGRSSSADVWSRTGFLQSDSLWKAFWEQSACQHNDRGKRIQHKGDEWEQRPSLEQHHERRDEKINAEEKDFILFIVLSGQFVMSVGCLRLWNIWEVICHHRSSDRLWCEMQVWRFLKCRQPHIKQAAALTRSNLIKDVAGCVKSSTVGWVKTRIHFIAAGLYNPSAVFNLGCVQLVFSY